MSARYSVLQYFPDPISGERINVGIIAWDEERTQTRFLRDWKRVGCFAGDNDPKFIEQVCNRLASVVSGRPVTNGVGSHEWLEDAIKRWEHCLQFTPPRGSLQDARALVEDLATVFLRERKVEESRDLRRNRRDAIRLALGAAREAAQTVLPEKAKEIVSRNSHLTGALERHQLDVVIRGANPIAAINALSFEVGGALELGRQIDAAAWVVEDVKNAHPSFPVAIFLIPPKQPNSAYERARSLFPRLQAEIIGEDSLPLWAMTRVEAAAGELTAHGN